jgi:hypothetical protein
MSVTQQKMSAICNGCGVPMRDMGEWPVTFPKGEGNPIHYHTLQCRRFACRTCRIPDDKIAKGYPVMVALIDETVEE